MYINYNGTHYPCECRPAKTMYYRGLPDDFPAPVSGEIILCADDGFVLRTDNADEYLRQTFENGILMLTNTPEYVEPETPEGFLYDEATGTFYPENETPPSQAPTAMDLMLALLGESRYETE